MIILQLKIQIKTRKIYKVLANISIFFKKIKFRSLNFFIIY